MEGEQFIGIIVSCFWETFAKLLLSHDETKLELRLVYSHSYL